MAAIPNISPVCINNEEKSPKEARKAKGKKKRETEKKKGRNAADRLAYSTWEY
jgi:hypothetical protein